MLFQTRAAAGKMLGEQLLLYKEEDPILVAVPRGGVVVASEVADSLAAPMAVLAVRRIRHPVSTEYAVGAIDENGMVIFNSTETAALERDYLEGEMEAQQKEASHRAAMYRAEKAPLFLDGKTVILIDDGMATGLTMRLAVITAKAQNPKRVIVAVPVASPESVVEIKRLEVEVFVLQPPEEFAGSVGEQYLEFEQVDDSEVLTILRRFV